MLTVLVLGQVRNRVGKSYPMQFGVYGTAQLSPIVVWNVVGVIDPINHHTSQVIRHRSQVIRHRSQVTGTVFMK
jgi:hypothetical protein